VVPISADLIKALKEYKEGSRFNSANDFIVSRVDGSHFGGRAISSIIERVREAAGLDISAHGLRHTFGREFALNTGNIKALQAILGHSSSAVTDIYSDLAGKRIEGFGEAVSFKADVKRRK
jgi:integrase/recombinase XerC